MSLRSGYSQSTTGGTTSGGLSAFGGSSVGSVPTASGGGSTTNDVGKAGFDFTDPLGSTLKSVGDIGQFLGDAGKAIGDIPVLGDILTAPFKFGGAVAGAVGSIPLVSDAISTGGNILGSALSALNAPSVFTEESQAELRIRDALRTGQQGRIKPEYALTHLTDTLAQTRAAGVADPTAVYNEALPNDIWQRAQAGEDPAALAKELTARGQGYSANVTSELVNQVTHDPLNLLSFGLNYVQDVAKIARIGGQAADDLNIVNRGIANGYNVLTQNASRGVHAAVAAAIGPATRGAIRAYGPGRVAGVFRAAGREASQYGEAIRDGFETFLNQIDRAVVGKGAFSEWKAVEREAIDQIDVSLAVEKRLQDVKRSATLAKHAETDAQHLIEAVKPRFLLTPAADLYETALRKVMAITGAPAEAAARILGKTVNAADAAIYHAAYYGKVVVQKLDHLKNDVLPFDSAATRAVQVDRLTPLAHETLTDVRAAALLADESPQAIVDAVERYDILKDKFGGLKFEHEKVRAYVKALYEQDGLLQEITTGLPRALREYVDEVGQFGYGVGYAPKSGWKVLIDENGDLLGVTDPFIHVQTGRSAATIRNPIGRLGDSLFATIHQRSIVMASLHRLQDIMIEKQVGSPGQARAIHRQILREAADLNVTPRALMFQKVKGENRVFSIFKEHLTDEQFADLLTKTSPEFLLLRAIEGNFGQVGWTQKLTGAIKTGEKAAFGTNWITRVTEDLYPKAKFAVNPFFQGQERFETPFLRAMRGIVASDMDPEVKKFITTIIDTDPNVRFLSEDWSGLYLNKGAAAAAQIVSEGTPTLSGKLRGVVNNVTNVAGAKHDATVLQAFVEAADQLERIIIDIDPRLWREMTAAAGSTDARVVMQHWIRERQVLSRADAAEYERMANAARDAEFYGPAPEIYTDVMEWEKSLTNAETEALNRYADSGYRYINNPLRGVTPVGAGDLVEKHAVHIQHLDSAIARAALSEPTTIFRGVKTPKGATIDYRALGPGDEFADPAFGSYTKNITMAEEFAGSGAKVPPVVIQLDAPAGFRAARISGSPEWEYLIGRDERMRVISSAVDEDGDLIIRVEPVNAGSPGNELLARADVSLQRGGLPAVSVDADQETIYQAFLHAFRESAAQARTTQYFREGRSFVERSLNHPFLGLYPLSYAIKMFGEFGRFLLKRPFGLRAPLVGLAAMNKFQQAVLVETSDPNSDMAKFVEKNPALLNFINQMLPYWPTNIGVSTPLWARTLAKDVEKGKPITLESGANALSRQIEWYLNPTNFFLKNLPSIQQDLNDSLEQSQVQVSQTLNGLPASYFGVGQ